ncbi:HTH-type transcriptional repressor PurR [Streptomyces antimycoticus]
MATMVDVARRAGVSVATVSHVLNETRPVRPDTQGWCWTPSTTSSTSPIRWRAPW